MLTLPGLFVVADGMGGHAAGDVASRLTVEAFATWPHGGTPPPLASLGDAVSAANRTVRGESRRSQQEGMGSTVVGLAVADNGGRSALVVFHVGDSRCYTLDAGGRLTLLTRDHSQVQEMVDAGEITTDEARRHPLRNVVTRAIGIEDQVLADFLVVPDAPVRRLVLCSDGVSGELDPDELERLLVDHERPDAACNAILGAVLGGRAADNATVIVVDVVDDALGGVDVEATGPRQRGRDTDDVEVTGPRPAPPSARLPVPSPASPVAPPVMPPVTPPVTPPSESPATPLIDVVPAGSLIEVVPAGPMIEVVGPLLPPPPPSGAQAPGLIDEVPS